MKKYLFSLVAASTITSLYAAQPITPPFALQRLSSHIIRYQLTPREESFAYALEQAHQGYHLVVINQLHHMLGRYRLHAAHQLAVKAGSNVRIALAEQYKNRRQLDVLSHFEAINQATKIPSIKSIDDANSYLTPSTLKLSSVNTKPTGQTDYPLYANGLQQLTIQVNFTSKDSSNPNPPYTDFDPTYFKQITFTLQNHPGVTIPIGQPICLMPSNQQCITINQQPGQYSYGIINTSSNLLAQPSPLTSPQQVNQYYVSLSNGDWNQENITLIASLAVRHGRPKAEADSPR